MDRLWAPWRMEYITSEKPSGCIFCVDTDSDDRERLILYRSSCSLVMLNRYPYTNGHIMVAPYRHTAEISQLSGDEIIDIFRMVSGCESVLREAAAPQGFNVGINIGKVAGAGVDDHLHVHIVPRWNGDTNFMTVVADLRVMPENLLVTYDRLLPLFAAAIGGAS